MAVVHPPAVVLALVADVQHEFPAGSECAALPVRVGGLSQWIDGVDQGADLAFRHQVGDLGEVRCVGRDEDDR
jgi:hypothetical protein